MIRRVHRDAAGQREPRWDRQRGLWRFRYFYVGRLEGSLHLRVNLGDGWYLGGGFCRRGWARKRSAQSFIQRLYKQPVQCLLRSSAFVLRAIAHFNQVERSAVALWQVKDSASHVGSQCPARSSCANLQGGLEINKLFH